MATNLMEASHQWATRPADERYWSLVDLYESVQSQKMNSEEHERKVSGVQAVAYEDELMLSAGQTPAKLTHWGMTQLARYADAPPSYLQTLPADLAASCINNGLKKYSDENVNLYVQKNRTDRSVALRSFLTERYSRLYNADIITNGLQPALESGWMVPPARPSSHADPRARPATIKDIVPGQENFALSVKVGDMISPAGVYLSDRDLFVFMVQPERIIDDGGKGMMRGFFLENSEVGAKSFKLKTFLLESVCGNHICWNSSDIKELRIVHKGRAIDGVTSKVHLTVKQFANASDKNDRLMIEKAKSFVIAKKKEEVIEWLFNNKQLGLSKGDVEESYKYAEKWEHTALAAPNTAFGWVHGLTRYSQTKPYADERHRLDSAGGKLLQLAFKS